MEPQVPLCIIRNLDDPHKATPPINCMSALDRAIKGIEGPNWQIEELILNTVGSACVLRIILRSTQDRKFVFVEHDDNFEHYFESFNTPAPKSVAIPLIKKNIFLYLDD